MSEQTVKAKFSIDLSPGEALLPSTGRMDFTKSWTGGMAGSSRGAMLSGGDPSTGHAGYVALEVFEGEIEGRTGTFVLQQFGVMSAGAPELRYEIAPGSGTGDLAGITGVVDLDIVDGVHQVTLRYAL